MSSLLCRCQVHFFQTGKGRLIEGTFKCKANVGRYVYRISSEWVQILEEKISKWEQKEENCLKHCGI